MIIAENKSTDINEIRKVSVAYNMLDKDSKATTIINHGEEMSFELIVDNVTNQVIKYEDERELLSSAFCVYTNDGNYVACAYLTDDLIPKPLTIQPGERYRTVQKWKRTPLAKGEYYSPIIIKVDNEEIINNILKFKIQ